MGDYEFSILGGGTFTFKTVSPLEVPVWHIFSKKDSFKWTHYCNVTVIKSGIITAILSDSRNLKMTLNHSNH